MGFERNPELPALPRFKLDAVRFNIDTLTRVFSEYRDQRITPELAYRMAIDANKAMPEVPETNLHQTFIQYVGQGMDEKLSGILAAQVSGRETELYSGPIIFYDRPIKPEWVAMEILWTAPTTWRETQPGTLFHFMALSGHLSGHIIKRKFPNGWLNFFAYRLGFSRRIEFDYDARHFIGLYLWGYLTPAPGSAEVRFNDWDLSSAFKKHNLQIIKLRTRFDHDKAVCPFEFDHHCFECHVGRDKCLASCHQVSSSNPRSSTQQNGG